MRRNLILLVIGPLALLMGGCTSNTPPVNNPTAKSPRLVVTRAQAALLPLKKTLKKELGRAMARGGVESAISVCGERAIAITQELNAKNPKAVVGRTSSRLRNPKNAPAAWLKPVLAHYQKSPPRPGSYRLVPLEDGQTGYAEPIYVKPFCLKCHGNNIKKEHADLLHELFPEDQAHGYEAGQFRGVFWVRLAP